MQVKIYKNMEEVDTYAVEAESIREVLAHIKFVQGQEYTDFLINNNFCYVLVDSTEKLPSVGLTQETLLFSFGGYDTLVIYPELSGNVTAAVVGGVLGVAATSWTAIIVTAVINIAISLAISAAVNAVMQAISPTPEFSNDPSETQSKQSSLFNGAPLIREQGGSVPIIYGNPFCGGVLISSGVSTEDY